MTISIGLEIFLQSESNRRLVSFFPFFDDGSVDSYTQLKYNHKCRIFKFHDEESLLPKSDGICEEKN